MRRIIVIIIIVLAIIIFSSAVFIALMLVGLSKCVKPIIQIELHRVKNPSWLDANKVAIYKHGRGPELGTIVMKSS